MRKLNRRQIRRLIEAMLYEEEGSAIASREQETEGRTKAIKLNGNPLSAVVKAPLLTGLKALFRSPNGTYKSDGKTKKYTKVSYKRRHGGNKEEISLVQQFLKMLGYYPEDAPEEGFAVNKKGFPIPAFKKAIQDFQKAHGETADGYVGPKTAAKMSSALFEKVTGERTYKEQKEGVETDQQKKIRKEVERDLDKVDVDKNPEINIKEFAKKYMQDLSTDLVYISEEEYKKGIKDKFANYIKDFNEKIKNDGEAYAACLDHYDFTFRNAGMFDMGASGNLANDHFILTAKVKAASKEKMPKLQSFELTYKITQRVKDFRKSIPAGRRGIRLGQDGKKVVKGRANAKVTAEKILKESTVKKQQYGLSRGSLYRQRYRRY